MMPWLKICGPSRYQAVLRGPGRLVAGALKVKVGAVCVHVYLCPWSFTCNEMAGDGTA